MQRELIADGQVIGNRNFFYCKNCEAPIARTEDYVPKIAASKQTDYFKEGRFFMKMNRVTLRSYILGSAYRRGLNQVGGANAQVGGPNAQVGGVNAHVGGANAQDGGPNDKDGGPNDQDGDANDQDGGPNDHDGCANDQDGGPNEQVPNEHDYQDVGANEQIADQDGCANEQNADQDGGASDQGPNDQDGGPPMKRRKK
uniref:Glycine-rich protein n=1 Tax=Solanum tuberosum TaxID=4113 RepID=M1DWB8_SOLTU